MISLIHGENISQSRLKLTDLVAAAKAQGKKIQTLEAKKITEADLELAFGSDSLFGESIVLVIEEVHSLPKSKKKDVLIAQLSQLAIDTPTVDVLIWEKRLLTPTMIKKFPKAVVYEFKLSSSLFKWLDSLSPNPASKLQQLKLLHETLQQEDAMMCWSMLARQVRLLIQAKEGAPLSGAPFMISKLQHQARAFTIEQLVATHHRLLEIDRVHKMSGHPLTLSQDLDLLVVRL